jgi:hypothetical protein
MNFRWLTRAEKLEVVAYWWKNQRGRCCLCNMPMDPYHRDRTHNPDAATIEHLIPRRESGPNTVGNVRLAHGRCNHALGALWEQNRHRGAKGLPPLTAKWALNSARGNELARKRLLKEAKKNDPASGTMAAGGFVSLPRGATLMSFYKGHVDNAKRIARPKMTAAETAAWLREKGIRGA